MVVRSYRVMAWFNQKLQAAVESYLRVNFLRCPQNRKKTIFRLVEARLGNVWPSLFFSSDVFREQICQSKSSHSKWNVPRTIVR